MAAGHDRTVPSSEETEKRLEWLIDITKEQELRKEPLIKQKEGQEQQTRPEAQIERVKKELRGIKTYKTHFDPLVVSFGPYHNEKKGLQLMVTYKNVAAQWFISVAAGKPGETITKDDAIKVYEGFLKNVEGLSPKHCYPGWTLRKYKDEDQLLKMMFLDGCFVLNFIHLVADRSDRTSGLYKCSSRLNQPAIIRDMFLLENQIPYTVLKALMSLTVKESSHWQLIIKYISMVFLPSYELDISQIGCIRVLFSFLKEIFTRTKENDADTEPDHLLDLLQAKLTGRGASPSSRRVAPSSPQGAQSGASPSSPKEDQSTASSSSAQSGYWYFCFRPIRELKAAGIQVRRSKSIFLQDVKFNPGPLNSHLEIPPIIVDDSTKTRLLNLVAYEMCSDGPKDRTVTSYICLLGSLIYNVDDVKELQSENILLNRLSSNEEVVKLFKDLATHLSPDCNAYGDVIKGIDQHHKRNFNRQRVRIGEWIGQFIRIYFTSPWTVTSLIAAIVLLLFTLLQTIYTIWGFYKTY